MHLPPSVRYVGPLLPRRAWEPPSGTGRPQLSRRLTMDEGDNEDHEDELPLSLRKPQRRVDFSNMVRQWRYFSERVNADLPHEDLHDNIQQRYDASRAPLFVVRTDGAPPGAPCAVLEPVA